MSVRTQVELYSTGRGIEWGKPVRKFKVNSIKLLNELGRFTYNKDGSIK